MAIIQTQGVHHITLVGSNREATIAFYEGVLGMPFVFEQPNLDVPEETHLYFDPGDGRLLTFFVRPTRQNDPTPNPEGIGNLHHLAFNVSRATYTQVARRLEELGISNTGPIDRGFMDSIYFRDPNGQLLELASYKFEPPVGYTHSDVLAAAHRIRVAAGAYAIADEHLADALLELVARRAPQPPAPAVPVGAGASSKGDGAQEGHEPESRL
ncbi:MAG TPA: VOC family protein [Chloroflexia bacterium]|jgi:catechol 2,3-dioxygenase-like lactoylglutathione lyase family enzyme